MLLFALLGFFFIIYQWLVFDRKVQHDNLYTKDTIVFARVLLNGWDWYKVDNPLDADLQISLILKNLQEAKAEEKAKIDVAERNEEQKMNLCMRRGYTYLL